MNRNAALPLAVTPPVPDYHGMAGEQAFYDALTVNLDWFEREMRASTGKLRRLRRAAHFRLPATTTFGGEGQ